MKGKGKIILVLLILVAAVVMFATNSDLRKTVGCDKKVGAMTDADPYVGPAGIPAEVVYNQYPKDDAPTLASIPLDNTVRCMYNNGR